MKRALDMAQESGPRYLLLLMDNNKEQPSVVHEDTRRFALERMCGYVLGGLPLKVGVLMRSYTEPLKLLYVDSLHLLYLDMSGCVIILCRFRKRYAARLLCNT
jgi:hypothetical protein